MENEITKNLVFLADSLTNLERILLHLEQKGIISTNERHGILFSGTPFERNMRFLDLIKRKDYNTNRKFILEILRQTNNGHCADKIEGITRQPESDHLESVNNEVSRVEQMLGDVNIPESSNQQGNQQSTIIAIANKLSEQIWFGFRAHNNKFFTGREEEIAILKKHWNDCLENKVFSIAAVTGLGGVGKSELIKKYAKWFWENVKGHCVWVDAETTQSLEQSFKRLAKRLKISLNDHLGKERIFQEIVEEVYETLFGEKVLFVFDNVENYEFPVLKLLTDLSSDKAPTILKPFVITTSRLVEAQRYFHPDDCNILFIDLPVLPKHSAMEFFNNSLSVNKTPGDNIHESIEKLCERLQFFPLAMQQAAAYINERLLLYKYGNNVHKEVINYLAQIEIQTKKLLNYKLSLKALEDPSKTTFLTWRITFDKLRESNDCGEITTDIMNIICFLYPDNIPTQMVINILKTKVPDTGNIGNLLERIRKYSMINLSEDSIYVHRLVQEVTRIELEERGEFLSILGGVTNCLKEMLIKEEISLKDLGHVQMVWQYLKRDKDMVERHVELLGLICQKVSHSGRCRDLLKIINESENLLESVFGQNRLGLKIKYLKGVALSDLGKYSESIEVLKYTYEKQKEALGEDDGDCLNTANEIGCTYCGLKKYEEAMTIYKDALEINGKINGKEHGITISLKNGIAMVLRAQNKFKEALEIYKEILEVEKRVFGVEHPKTLTIYHNIATIKFNMKDYLEALKEFQEVLEKQERVLVLNHPNALLTKYHIAVMYYHLGRHKESLQMFTEVHESSLEMLGPKHPQTIETEGWIEKVGLHIALLSSSATESFSILNEIPEFVMDMFKRKDISLEELVEIQTIWKHLNREKEMNEESGISLSNICTKWLNSGKHKNLLDFSSKFEELVASVLPQNNRWTLRMKYWKELALKGLGGDSTKSIKVLKVIWNVQKSIFGEEDDYCLDTAQEVGNVFRELNQYEEAMHIFENTLEKRERVLGKEDEKTLSLKNSIALVLSAQNKVKESLQLNTEILDVQERLLGVEHPDTLTTKHNIALVKFQQKNYKEALKEFHRVLEIQERVLELNHPNTLNTKCSIALTYYHLGRHQESLDVFKQVHKKLVQILGPWNPQTITTEEFINVMET